MAFGRFIGGIILMLLAIVIAVLGVAVLVGLLGSFLGGLEIPSGIVILVVALLLFAYGWYSFKSSEPKGTYNIRNVDEHKK